MPARREECTSWTGGLGFASWGQGGDKKERKVECTANTGPSERGPPKPVKCTCTVDGVVGKTYEQCGWHLE